MGTESCLAWQIIQLPPIKARDSSADPSPEEVASWPEVKRRRYEAQENDRLSKIPSVTQKIIFKEFTVNPRKLDDTNLTHKYEYPVMVDREDFKEVYHKKCHRAAIPFDSYDTFKKLKKDKINKTF